MALQLSAYIERRNVTDPLIVGIRTAGVWLAAMLHKKLKLQSEFGELNINYYRDDFSKHGLHPQIEPSKLPFSIEDRHIILVDDVLYTGRTTRAAMNELFDYGRPASIVLAVLFEREGIELPVSAQVVGISRHLATNQYIALSGPENMELTIQTRS
jgi:pyrimidine operon attenuation protein/uracil phosphoribosyltransferase